MTSHAHHSDRFCEIKPTRVCTGNGLGFYSAVLDQIYVSCCWRCISFAVMLQFGIFGVPHGLSHDESFAFFSFLLLIIAYRAFAFGR